MSVRRLFSLMKGLGYEMAEASSTVSKPQQEPAASNGLAQLVAMRPKNMDIVYSPKPGDN